MPRSSFTLDEPRRTRRPSLTPMVDVVFLLLVFFMLAARFGVDAAIPLSPAQPGSGGYKGAPRLVTVEPDGLKLNGFQTNLSELPGALRPLMPGPEATIVLRATTGTDLQRLVTVIDVLSAAGMQRIVLVE